LSTAAKVISFLTITNSDLRDVRAGATAKVVTELDFAPLAKWMWNDPNILRGWADGLDS
jgi:hypothetical protein